MVLKGTLRRLVPLRLSARSQAPRADLLDRLRPQIGVERLLQHELELLPAGIFEQPHYLVLVKCNIDLSHVRAFKSSCSLAIANDTWNPSLWLVPLFTPLYGRDPYACTDPAAKAATGKVVEKLMAQRA
jgi:hypothetical protein